MNNKMRRTPKSIGDILKSVARKQGWEDKLSQHKIPQAWEEIIEPGISKITKIIKFSRGTLIIRVDSPTWRYELNLREQKLREDLNNSIGEKLVSRIIFK